ncbi:hypothetical protein F4810DRAFT_709482 [Camillea tinctor]|nr:hypothetical protein F4810DRAFT_709482 [Camillea tinctor]
MSQSGKGTGDVCNLDDPALGGFYSRYLSYHDYWSRVWVVQEVLLASRMTVWSGFFTFPLSIFAGSSPPAPTSTPKITFANDDNGCPRSILRPSSQRLCSPAEKVVSHRTRQMLLPGTDVLAQGTEVGTLEEMTFALRSNSSTVVETYQSTVMDPLYEVVRKFGGLRCSDARDKLYGFLGIMNEYARAQVKPDYTQDVRFAFYQALKIGTHEICTEEAGLANIQHPPHVERLYDYVNYYRDARDAFGIDDIEGLPILRHFMGKLQLHYETNIATGIAEAQPQRHFLWRDAEVGVYPDFKQLSRSAEPVKPVYNVGWPWRFHHSQFRLL